MSPPPELLQAAADHYRSPASPNLTQKTQPGIYPEKTKILLNSATSRHKKAKLYENSAQSEKRFLDHRPQNGANHKRPDDANQPGERVQSGGGKTGRDEELREIKESEGEAFCFCKQPSFGEMIECESERCEIKWFHCDCVGAESYPADKMWFCGVCAAGKDGEGGGQGAEDGVGL